MSCGKPLWKLLKESAEELTKQGKVPFSRKDLIDCVRKTHPNKKKDSLSPMIQGITVNVKGGSPGGTGKNILYKVERGLFVLYDPQKHGGSNVDIEEGKNRKVDEKLEKISNFYNKFYDPTDKFKEEPRYFCYELAIELINKAKKLDRDWYTNENTIKGILLLLFCWNFAAKETKRLNFKNLKEVLLKCKNELNELENYPIEIISETDNQIKEKIEKVYNEFKNLMGQTGASKALSLLNSQLFVMWDTKIRKYLGTFIRNIDNGEKPQNYWNFLLGIKEIILKYKIKEKLPADSIVAKKIDEYHYIEIVMKENS